MTYEDKASYHFTPHCTAYCIWSVISPISKLNQLSSSLGLFCHVPLKRDQLDWDYRMRLNDTTNTIGCTCIHECACKYLHFIRVCMCVCVCVCVCVHLCVCVCVWVYWCQCVHSKCNRMYMYAWMCLQIFALHTRMYVCVCECACVCFCVHWW